MIEVGKMKEYSKCTEDEDSVEKMVKRASERRKELQTLCDYKVNRAQTEAEERE